MDKHDPIGAAQGRVRLVLRLEGLAVLIGATAIYFGMGGPWWLFLVLLFAPDLSFAAYGGGNRLGAIIYNLAHSYIMPIVVGGLGLLTQNIVLQQLALIHAAHIGLDRSLGYGLKYASGFKHTHLGRLGRD